MNNNNLHDVSLDQIEKIQFEKLRKTLDYTSLNSPFYKEIFHKLRISPKDIKSLEDFKKIPFTLKDDLQNKNMDFLCIPRAEIAEISSTSGTLGKPVYIAQSANDLDRLSFNESLSFSIANLEKSDLIQLMTTMDKRFMAGLAYFLGAQKLGSGIVRVGSGVPELQWDTIISLDPTVIIAVPSFIVHLLEYAEANDIDYRKTSVKKAICIGESIRNPDLSLNTLGKLIRDRWDIELYSTYASTEMGAAFTECGEFQGGHLIPELVYLEVLDENGNSVANGESGEVVITTLGVEAMPLIRYKTGDICHLYTQKCACGRTTPRLGPVIGRGKHMIKYKGTTLYPPALFNILNEFREIQNYLIEVKDSEVHTDEIVIHILCEKKSQVFLQSLKDHFKSKLRVIPNIHYIDSEELLRIQSPDKNRKPVKLIDMRSSVKH